MNRVFLVIIMMISTLGIFSFKSYATDANTSFVSYYHDKFDGKKTASGEVFSNASLTAANKTLPFGTLVKITNLISGKSVVVKVNDRGPYHSSRAFDLSKAAFKTIADIRKGTIAIEYEILD